MTIKGQRRIEYYRILVCVFLALLSPHWAQALLANTRSVTGFALCSLVNEYSNGAWVGAYCDNFCANPNDCHVLVTTTISQGERTKHSECSACDGGTPDPSDCRGKTSYNLSTGVVSASRAGSRRARR